MGKKEVKLPEDLLWANGGDCIRGSKDLTSHLQISLMKRAAEQDRFLKKRSIEVRLERFANEYTTAKQKEEEKIEAFEECIDYEVKMCRRGLLPKISTYEEWAKALKIPLTVFLKYLEGHTEVEFEKETRSIRRQAYKYIKACENEESKRRDYRKYFIETIIVVRKARQNRLSNPHPYGIKPPYWH